MNKASSPEGERVIWHRPTEYNPYRDGPPYLPTRPFEPVKLSSEQRQELHAFVRKANKVLVVAEDTGSPLTQLLALLQATALLHQTHHWSTRGRAYYADHQLFERLYNESLEFIDQVAERAVGLGQPFIGALDQVRNMQGFIGSFGHAQDAQGMVQVSLQAEMACLTSIKSTLDGMERAGTLTPGTSNLLEGAADKHETFVYLLRQRAQGDGDDYSYDRT